jgi:hypothetical protein
MSKWLQGDDSTFHSTPAEVVVHLEGTSASKFSVLLKGDFGSATMAFLGGDGTNYAPIMVTSPADGTTHFALEATVPGLYTFSAVCTHLKLSLSGGAAPDMNYAVLCEARQ